MITKDANRVKVLYLAGWGRSGSTLLSNVLGNIPGFFTVGEVRYIWSRGIVGEGKCGCGTSLLECNTWKEILKMFEKTTTMDYSEIADLCYQQSRQKNLLSMFYSLHSGKLSSELKKWLKVLETFYVSISDYTNGAIIVDSSKSPIYAAALRQIPLLDVYIVHLVRDPRPVAFSWTKPKGDLDKHSPFFTSLMWSLWNGALEDLRLVQPHHYLQLRYEDFVASPYQAVKQLVSFVNGSSIDLPFSSGNSAYLGVTHNVSGNPNRFELGEIKVSPDDRWKKNMPKTSKILVTLLTLPLMLRYHYPLFP